MQTLTLTRPDDWHIHLRDGDYLPSTVADVAERFGRAIVMPNLAPPVTTVPQALAYRDQILLNRPPGSDFQPLMTLYLTDQTRPSDIIAAAQSPPRVWVQTVSGRCNHQFRCRRRRNQSLVPDF